VTQHQKEIKVLQTQFQQLLDLKDKEIESFAYRLKTVTASQQKDIEKLNEDFKQKMANLEAECQDKEEAIKSKTLEMKWMAAESEGFEVKQDQKMKFFSRSNYPFLFFRPNLKTKVQNCRIWEMTTNNSEYHFNNTKRKMKKC
jgi:hypothetical protein